MPTNDLHSYALRKLTEIQRPANVHFTEDGSRYLAQQVAAEIERRLPERSAAVRHVVLISVDGLAASYLDDPRANLPTLRMLAKKGARADGMITTFPSVTWPSHTSLVTGTRAASHGVIGNSVFDRRAGRAVGRAEERRAVGREGGPAAAELSQPLQPWRLGHAHMVEGMVGHAVTACFMTLALAQIFHLGNARSSGPVVALRRITANRWALAAIAISVALQLATVTLPGLQLVLGTVALTAREWLIVAVASLTPALLGQVTKLRRGRRTQRS